MRKLLRRRKVVAALTMLAVAGLAAGLAMAYYGGTGQGSASAAAGHSPEAVTVTVNSGNPLGTLYPGQSEAVPYTIARNQGGSGNVHIGSVTGSISVDAQHASAGCLGSWFTFDPGAGQFPANVPASPGSAFAGSLSFTNTNSDQSACSDAALTLTVTANPN